MIQTKTLKEALKDPGVIEVVEELIGEAGANKTGLLSAQKFKEYPHFLKGYNSTYKIASNVKNWERRPILLLHNFGNTSYLDILSYAIGADENKYTITLVHLLKDAENVRYYKKNRDIYVCFRYEDTQPNNTYILSSHGVERVGDSKFVDDSFTEII